MQKCIVIACILLVFINSSWNNKQSVQSIIENWNVFFVFSSLNCLDIRVRITENPVQLDRKQGHDSWIHLAVSCSCLVCAGMIFFSSDWLQCIFQQGTRAQHKAELAVHY